VTVMARGDASMRIDEGYRYETEQEKNTKDQVANTSAPQPGTQLSRRSDSRNVVIHSGKRTIRPPDDPLGVPQPFKGLRRGDLVYQVSVDVNQRLVGRVDEVVVVDLVVERAWGRCRGGHGECIYVSRCCKVRQGS
jgi:hypothetical protein